MKASFLLSRLKLPLLICPAVFLLLSSCKEKTIVIPDSVLSMDTMAAVLVDVQLLEAMKIKSGINDSVSVDSILFQYALIFNKHKITQEQFEQSFDFYKTNPELLEEIYDKTISELSRMQAMLGNINIAIADSIKKSREKSVVPAKKPKDEKKKQETKKKSTAKEVKKGNPPPKEKKGR